MLSRRKDRRELLETLRRMKNDSVAILREERGRVGFVPGQGLVERVLNSKLSLSTHKGTINICATNIDL